LTDTPAGDGKMANLFLQCTGERVFATSNNVDLGWKDLLGNFAIIFSYFITYENASCYKTQIKHILFA